MTDRERRGVKVALALSHRVDGYLEQALQDLLNIERILFCEVKLDDVMGVQDMWRNERRIKPKLIQIEEALFQIEKALWRN